MGAVSTDAGPRRGARSRSRRSTSLMMQPERGAHPPTRAGQLGDRYARRAHDTVHHAAAPAPHGRPRTATHRQERPPAGRSRSRRCVTRSRRRSRRCPSSCERTPVPASGAWGGARSSPDVVASVRPGQAPSGRRSGQRGVGRSRTDPKGGRVGLRAPLLRDARRDLRQRLVDVLAMPLQTIANVLQ